MATTGASLQPIYERLNKAPSYHPLSADTFADWSMEAGDIITVTRDGNSYKAPVHGSKLSWKKGQKISVTSEGSEKRKAVAKVSQKKYGGGGSALRNNDYQHLYVEDAYNRMSAGLELTTSTSSFYVQDAYDRLKSGLDLTASSANLYVESLYNQMSAGLVATSSSAMLYAKSRTSRAEIIARINAKGEGEALINADRVAISGRTTINDVLSITGRTAQFSVPIRVEGNVMAESLTLRGGSSGETISDSDLAGMIKKATVEDNVLTLTPVHGDPITFSKATSLSGEWSGDQWIVTASPQGNQLPSDHIQVHPVSSQGGDYTDVYVGTTNGSSWSHHGNAARLTLYLEDGYARLKDRNGGVMAQKANDWSYQNTASQSSSAPTGAAKTYNVSKGYDYAYFNVTVNGQSKRIVIHMMNN